MVAMSFAKTLASFNDPGKHYDIAYQAPPVTSPALSAFGYSTAWDFKTNKPLAIVDYTYTVNPNLFAVQGLTLGAVAFTGSGSSTSFTGGAGGGVQKVIGKVTLTGGLGYGYFVNQKAHLIAFAGVKGFL